MKLHTISRDKLLYKATALFEDGIVTVQKGSKINLNKAPKFNPPQAVSILRNDSKLFSDSILLKDIKFSSLSEAATFVTGRVANGMIVWKTEDGKYIKHSITNGGGK